MEETIIDKPAEYIDSCYCEFFECPKCKDTEIQEEFNYCPMCGIKIKVKIK